MAGFPPQGYAPYLTQARAEIIDSIPSLVQEEEWATDSVVDNVASVAETSLSTHTISASDFVFQDGIDVRRVLLVAMINACPQSSATHHIGLKVQVQVNDGGWVDQLDFTTNPPLGAPADASMGGLTLLSEITSLVSSGDKVDLRFRVDSDNAGSVNYTTSFTVMLVYTVS